MSLSKLNALTSNNSRQMGVEYLKNNNGTQNNNYVDVLDVDKPIAGQNFCCISFISPEKILKQKEIFYMEEFIKQIELAKSLEKYNQFLHFISFKYNLSFNDISQDLQSFIVEEKKSLSKNDLLDDYKTFLDKNEDNLEKTFNEMYNFQTSVRGIKVRGNFPSQQEAELRCKMIREIDPNHDVYVGPVGMWMPFHPEAYKTGKVEYLEPELNQLMHEKKKNEDNAKNEFEKRVKESKEKAIEENKKNAVKSGNKLTQTINSEGNLDSVKDMNTQDDNLSSIENVSSADIRKELFEGDNIVTPNYKENKFGDLSKLQFT